MSITMIKSNTTKKYSLMAQSKDGQIIKLDEGDQAYIYERLQLHYRAAYGCRSNTIYFVDEIPINDQDEINKLENGQELIAT